MYVCMFKQLVKRLGQVPFLCVVFFFFFFFYFFYFFYLKSFHISDIRLIRITSVSML